MERARHAGFPRRSPHRAAWLLVLLAAWAIGATAVRADDATSLVVDTRSALLTVVRDGEPIRHYGGIAIGRNGAATVRRRGDDRTPLGEYRVSHITTDTHFRVFIGIDYPSVRDAEYARSTGDIDLSTYHAIRDAHLAGRQPPQDTVLGGFLGIHGLGEGDPRIHAAFNWTNGCVALTNVQIDDLARLVEPGTPVLIR